MDNCGTEKKTIEVVGKRITVIKAGADGESAYQIAVRNGFVGTEEEWLLSLVGADGVSGAYHHTQGFPSTVWNINHNLGYNPGGITIEDSAHRNISGGEIDYIDLDNLTITFAVSFSGTADMS